MKRVTIRVPATTANLGPGFDAFGCALSLYTDVTFEETEDAYIGYPCINFLCPNAKQVFLKAEWKLVIAPGDDIFACLNGGAEGALHRRKAACS